MGTIKLFWFFLWRTIFLGLVLGAGLGAVCGAIPGIVVLIVGLLIIGSVPETAPPLAVLSTVFGATFGAIIGVPLGITNSLLLTATKRTYYGQSPFQRCSKIPQDSGVAMCLSKLCDLLNRDPGRSLAGTSGPTYGRMAIRPGLTRP